MADNVEIRKPISNAKLWATLNLSSAALLSAQLVSVSESQVFCVWSQRDLVSSKKRLFSTTHMQSKSGRYVASPPVEIHEPCTPDYFYSPSRSKFVKFSSKNGGSQGSSGPIFAEVWGVGTGLSKVWEIDSTTHGSIYTDEWFGSVAWSPDETMVAYIADSPAPSSETESSADQEDSWIHPLRHKFHEAARDRFGEGYVNKRTPTLFIADLEKGRSYPLTLDYPLSDGQKVFFGEPQWCPRGRKIVAIMRHTTNVDPNEPPADELILKEFGLRYCYNRYSAIVAFDAPQCGSELESLKCSVQKLSCDESPDDFCCSSPRFSPDGSDLIYVSAPRRSSAESPGLVLPHNTTKVLRVVHMTNEQRSPPQTLISVPNNPERDEFPGLYLHGLLQNPWLDDETIVLTSTWGSVNKILSTRLAVSDGHFNAPAKAPEFTDWNQIAAAAVLRADANIDLEHDTMTALNLLRQTSDTTVLIFSASNPGTPSRVFSLTIKSREWSDAVVHPVTTAYPSTNSLRSPLASTHTVDLVATPPYKDFREGCATEYIPSTHERHQRFQVTLLLPRRSSSDTRPLLVYPHGGPHVATLNGYSYGSAAFLHKGFAVLYINYRGSLGLGQKSLETLPGKVGTQDVNEVVQATRWALSQSCFCLDASRAVFVGGSHSGFLGAHTSLIPHLFQRTVLRNPVVNLATMFGATDIPDWCFCEAGLPSRNERGLHLAADAQQLAVMYACSPVSKVRAAGEVEGLGETLLQVGGGDRRVPPQQSLEWKWTRERGGGGGGVRVRWYEGVGHAIEEVPMGDDAMVHALEFLEGVLREEGEGGVRTEVLSGYGFL